MRHASIKWLFFFFSMISTGIPKPGLTQMTPGNLVDTSDINAGGTPAPRISSSYNQRVKAIMDSEVYEAITAYEKEKFMKSPSFILSIVLLVFALVLSSLQVYLYVKGKLTSSQVTKLMLITLIIFSVLFLITAGYDNNQIAPAVGLLGTIAGYLLGRQSPELQKP